MQRHIPSKNYTHLNTLNQSYWLVLELVIKNIPYLFGYSFVTNIYWLPRICPTAFSSVNLGGQERESNVHRQLQKLERLC